MKVQSLALILVGALLSLPAVPSSAAGPLNVSLRHFTNYAWAGYATETNLSSPQSGAITDVQGSWTVPTLTCTSTDAYSSSWVGIDGYADSTIEQTGTDHNCIGGSAQYSAWYELFPKNTKEIPLAIHAGDSMSAEVRYIGNSNFLFTLTDANDSPNGTFTITLKMQNAELQSAEWIVEPPAQGNKHAQTLANYGNETFTNCSVTINGVTGSITSGQYDPMTVIDQSGTVIATPSKLTKGGTSFSVPYSG